MSAFYRTVVLFLVVLMAAPMLSGCGKKKKKSEVRAESGEAKLVELMTARRIRILSKLPEKDVREEDEHPWLAWIGRFAGVQSRAELRKVGVLARGTKVATIAEYLATWFDSQKRYYRDAKMAPKAYYRDLNIALQASKGKSWEQDLAFEILLFHAAEAARTDNMFAAGYGPQDDRVTRFFTYWKLVWGFEPKTSLFQEETNKLCNTKLGAYCKDIPMELRPFQVMRPYYEKVVANIGDFKKQYPQSPYNPFLSRVSQQYQECIKNVPKWEEKPVLAEIRSTVAAPIGGNAVLYVTDEGVALMDNLLRKKDVAPKTTDDKGNEKETGPPWQPTWAPDAGLTTAISALVEDVRSSKISNFNQSIVLLVTQANIPVRYLGAALRATIVGDHAKEWFSVMLVGRNRSDGSNRRAGYMMSLLATDKAVAFKLKAKGSKKASKCKAWGVIGKDVYDAKGFSSVVFVDDGKLYTGKLAVDGTVRSQLAISGDTSGKALESWGDQQTSSIVVAVPETATYTDLLRALNGVALRCEKDECRNERSQPVFVATCS